ncbi:two-component regulator propeller domain-containing protein [Flavobacterium flavipallidum]|uniref:Two-component regulator propeller domain-containing protein n=1 Tax=Flavobacterium flavipallidum TaxID=3139140 RepID=A0ABU9HPV8_9FLAO
MYRFFYVLVFLISCMVYGQNIKFKTLTTADGLSNNSVSDIVSDATGGLWIATWDGLNFYDGYRFIVYKEELNNNNSLKGNMIFKLVKDNQNHIWVLTDRAVSVYLGNHRFKNYFFKKTPSALSLSEHGQVLIHIQNKSFAFSEGKFKLIQKKTVSVDPHENLKSLLLSKYPKVIINDVLKDSEGSIWFATRRNGLYRISNATSSFNNNYIEHYTYDLYAPYSFNSNEIEKLFEDDFGNVWLGHKDGGLSMAYKGSDQIKSILPHPVQNPNLPNETIRAITLDPNNTMWLGYYTKGIYCSHGTKFTKFFITESSSNPDWNRVRSLFTASDGSVWVGTYAGLIRIKNGSYVLYESKKNTNFPADRNYSIYEDTNAQLWIGCWGGVAKFNLKKNTFEPFIGQPKLNKLHVRKVEVYKNQLFAGTEHHGVVQLDLKNGKVKTITTANGILGNSIYSLYKDPTTHYLWIASLGGISIYDVAKNKLVKNITEADGLPSHMVYALLLNGNTFWLSTTKGIASVDKTTYRIKSYNPVEGWQGAEFSEGSYFQDKKGIMFFGGVNGLNYFNPNTLQANKIIPKIKLIVDGNENYTSEIEKTFSNNQLEIELIPIMFPVNKKLKVFYKLEGREDDWVLFDNTNKIKYSNLSSGNYKFLVKVGEKGVVKPVCFSLHISKAFYETILFYILIIISILVGSVLFFYYKDKQVIARQKYLEDQIQERTKVIENQKRDLQNINEKLDKKNKKILAQKEKLLMLHSNLKRENFEIEKFKSFMLSEFQEPISKIIKNVATLKKNTPEHRELINQSNQLVNLISGWNYLDHIKELGEVKKSVIDLFSVLKNSVLKIEKELQHNRVSFNCEMTNSVFFVEIDELRLKLLLQYFFNDISKYSDAESSLDIKMEYENQFLEITVNSTSEILKNNWNTILHYSPYFKAVQVLLQDLKGDFVNKTGEEFQLLIQIPIEQVEQQIQLKETISWKHFDEDEKMSDKETPILVFSDPSNFSVAHQVLEHPDCHLIFESEAANLNAVLKQINVAVIVLYQANFTKELIHFLNSNKDSDHFNTPILFISEDINYELNEQLLEYGVDTLIQLPASTSFIQKKIKTLVNRKQKSTGENTIQKKIFQILTTQETIETPNDKLLKRALEIIKEELSEPDFNVEILADKLEISRVKCYRLFKETLKQSPSDILMSLRLQKAELLLKTRNLNISEVSFECGYNDPKYFGRSFKKYFGKSPKAFKSQSA